MALMRKDGEGARRIDGEGVYLRAPELRDYQDWADLRDASRGYLTPWEPTWAQDETSRGSFRYKLRRYAEDARDDKAYALFVFRDEDDALIGGVTLSNIRRGVAQIEEGAGQQIVGMRRPIVVGVIAPGFRHHIGRAELMGPLDDGAEPRVVRLPARGIDRDRIDVRGDRGDLQPVAAEGVAHRAAGGG